MLPLAVGWWRLKSRQRRRRSQCAAQRRRAAFCVIIIESIRFDFFAFVSNAYESPGKRYAFRSVPLVLSSP